MIMIIVSLGHECAYREGGREMERVQAVRGQVEERRATRAPSHSRGRGGGGVGAGRGRAGQGGEGQQPSIHQCEHACASGCATRRSLKTLAARARARAGARAASSDDERRLWWYSVRGAWKFIHIAPMKTSAQKGPDLQYVFSRCASKGIRVEAKAGTSERQQDRWPVRVSRR
ncbi:hypothetical protein MPTK1_3g07280 [Marchantia polymorpha subsp. ruderalis]|uniref:Uncharacterized protein n=2 Tax=Marchantia polymorpha TaxID=3197 RepID=A0AAF6AYA9_MARPO|nr:hypothetical protein MARPO_0006s0202 [Marchantia polymorpha]BBN04743.1 hypothetical protein Mp_3g07280 [Marchantia polymorpha subsp. ruderalis]|eukprot:PTQ48188.1 hypothetical protein MARPO_0006s0202 [Marchantia polymorpha]